MHKYELRELGVPDDGRWRLRPGAITVTAREGLENRARTGRERRSRLRNRSRVARHVWNLTGIGQEN